VQNTNTNIPTDRELPSTQKLVKSTILAAATAAVLLVTVVMPAEYGIDPTGIGNLIGLKKMGEIRVSLAQEEAADKAQKSGTNTEAKQSEVNAVAAPAPKTVAAIVNHETQVKLAPNEGAEIKVEMSKGKKVQYVWSTDGGKANFDMHADSKKLNIEYHQYSKGAEQRKEGELVAAFDGAHGWFWRNRTSQPITITLKTKGEYTDIKRMK
jgi:hypothetical protein